jgi:hypothetical protein
MANLQSFTFSGVAAFSVTHGDAPAKPARASISRAVRASTGRDSAGAVVQELAVNAINQGTNHITKFRTDAAADWPAITTETIRVGTISATRPLSGQIQFALQRYGSS